MDSVSLDSDSDLEDIDLTSDSDWRGSVSDAVLAVFGSSGLDYNVDVHVPSGNWSCQSCPWCHPPWWQAAG